MSWAGLAIAGSLSAGAACPEPVAASGLVAALDRAEARLGRFDIAGFRTETDALTALLPCVSEAVEPAHAARLHRVLGIRAFGERDPDAPKYFAAARSIEPWYVFPEALIPAGTPVRAAYEEIALDERRLETVPAPAEGRFQFDGTVSLDRPTSWPTLLQSVDGDGAVALTTYLRPADPMPVYEVWSGKKPPPGVVEAGASKDGVRHAATLGATATAGVATVALYALAIASEGRYKEVDDRPLPDAELDAARGRTNTLGTAALIAGASTVAGGVVVLVTW